MIFRKAKSDISLQHVLDHINNNSMLRLNVIDASIENGTLVILCNEARLVKITKLALEHHWPGNIEVHCMSDLAVRTGQHDATLEQIHKSKLN